jgi:hypothetical protein
MSRRIITIIVVILLLAGISVVNYMRQMDPTQLAARGVGKGGHHHHDEEAKTEDEPPPLSRNKEDFVAPIGPENAPVKIQAVYSGIDTVQSELRPILEQAAALYSPHVRVEFIDATDQKNRAMIDAVSKDLYMGLIINGEVTKEVPASAFGMVAFIGSPAYQQWSVRELYSAIERELEKKGVQFESHLDDIPSAPAHEHEHGHEGHEH